MPSTSEQATDVRDFDNIWENFQMTYPVTVDGKVPSDETCKQASMEHKHKLYEHWLKAQKKMRMEQVICKYILLFQIPLQCVKHCC